MERYTVVSALWLISLTCLLSNLAVSQPREGKQWRRSQQLEIREGFYSTAPIERQTSAAFRRATPGFFMTQVNVDDSSRNILGDAANEPSIAIDPANPNRMAIGWRQFNTVNSSFRQAGYAYTTNGGQTWRFPGVIQPGIFRSDPVLDSDSEGVFYYNSLSSDTSGYFCHVFKSTDGGVTWDNGTFAQGGDKQWMAIDKTGGEGNGHIYAYWTSYYSICSPGFFTRSTNGGISYENCVTVPGNPYWGTLDVGPDGELYVFGSTDPAGFILAKSTTARDSNSLVTWDTTIAINLDGEIRAFAGITSPNPVGLLGQAWVAVDRSNTPTRGNVYVLCSVERNSNTDPLDIMFSRSTDGGLTWSAPVRVNDDTLTTAWQWFGTMSVAPNGRVDVVWLDTRDNLGSVHSSLYYTYSTDAGSTWQPNRRLSNAFDPHIGWPQQNKMGDYFDMVSDNDGVHLAWAATFNGEQDVYYGRITALVNVTEKDHFIPSSFFLFQNYPNPFNPETIIDFQLPEECFVSLKIFNAVGQEIATLVDGPKRAGLHRVSWNAQQHPTGMYFYRLNALGFAQIRKLILLR